MAEALNSLTQVLQQNLDAGAAVQQQAVAGPNLFSTILEFEETEGPERANAWITELQNIKMDGMMRWRSVWEKGA